MLPRKYCSLSFLKVQTGTEGPSWQGAAEVPALFTGPLTSKQASAQ